MPSHARTVTRTTHRVRNALLVVLLLLVVCAAAAGFSLIPSGTESDHGIRESR